MAAARAAAGAGGRSAASAGAAPAQRKRHCHLLAIERASGGAPTWDDGDGLDTGVTRPAGASLLERLAAYGEKRRTKLTEGLDRAECAVIEHDWRRIRRDAQTAPAGDWRTWLILGGRGFGKTRAGAEWVRGIAETHPAARIALVGTTLAEARAVMIDGESGLLAIARGRMPALFESSTRRLVWANGAQAFLYSANEPESLRGPQHSHAWCDEIGKWAHATETWDNLAFGLRLGSDPRTVVTTTPRPVALVRRLVADGAVARTRGRTADNRAHLADAFVETVTATYGGTALGRQELDGELIEELAGALWSRALIEARRVATAPELRRVVVAVDPPAGAGAASDACGIVVAGLGADGHAYVLADASVQGLSPEGWARAVAAAARAWDADRVVAEANNGGAMVESVLRAADAGLAVKRVHAAHGKTARAEPVAALYEAGRAFHAGVFPALEDELAGLMRGGDYAGPGRSPDRADACVWALTELMLGAKGAVPGVRVIG